MMLSYLLLCYSMSSDFLLLLLLSESLVIKYSVQTGHTAQDQPIFRLVLFYHCLIVVVVHCSKYETFKSFFLKNETSLIFDHIAY